MHRHIPTRLTPAKANKKPDCLIPGNPAIFSSPLRKPVAFRPRLTAGLAFVRSMQSMRTIVVMSMKNYKDYEGVWKKELSKLATKIADHLPRSLIIAWVGKNPDMI